MVCEWARKRRMVFGCGQVAQTISSRPVCRWLGRLMCASVGSRWLAGPWIVFASDRRPCGYNIFGNFSQLAMVGGSFPEEKGQSQFGAVNGKGSIWYRSWVECMWAG
ncbi:hypothetical protein Salat_2654800 [Sesamum alatum]|uniref:Uncharacterized protein n=1 Tax=Sesamum alatum TaxID=300844 RepID=A0AAE2CAV7_9LAMI|nr:hypothetical protein Salat_2654800 [Sesamum alatum]